PSRPTTDYCWPRRIGITYTFFFSSRRRHTRSKRDWSSDVCSSDLVHECQQLAHGDQVAHLRNVAHHHLVACQQRRSHQWQCGILRPADGHRSPQRLPPLDQKLIHPLSLPCSGGPSGPFFTPSSVFLPLCSLC